MTAEKPTLLLVENDPFTLSLYQRELTPYYIILSCETENLALRTVQKTAVDLAILEPANGNGWVWDFADKLQQDEHTQSIPVIFCTIIDERKKGMEKGAAAYLLKPVYAHVLRQYVDTILARQEVPQID